MKNETQAIENNLRPLTVEQEHEQMRQRAFEFDQEMDGTGVVMAEAFVRGMRDIGYKNTAYAINEIIDNAIEARASNVLVEMLEGKKGVEAIAVIDDGMGMPKEWLRQSIRWGASHRDQRNLKGFGRFGYGLKSAAISFARRVQIYSRIAGEKDWASAFLDVDDLAAGTYRTEKGGIGVPPVTIESLPPWLLERLSSRGVELDHGTIVVMTKIDSDRIRTRADAIGASDPDKLRGFFMEQFGITYRNYLMHVPLRVDGNKVDPIDPLFITPGYRFYDVDPDRAEALPPLVIPIKGKDRKDIAGFLRCRFSIMPPTFLRKPEHKLKEDTADGRGHWRNMNERFSIRRDNNGVIVLRAGRQIDVVNRNTPMGVFQNNDRYIGVEVDFDPSLDSEFSVPTSKQQVVPSKRIWDILVENGVADAVRSLKKRDEDARKKLKELHKATSPDKKSPDDPDMTPSEAAMKAAEKFAPPTTQIETIEQLTRAEDEFRDKVEEEAKVRGVPTQRVREEKERQAKVRPYKVALESKGAQAPFFRAVQEGGQRILYINRDHRFYLDVYSNTDALIRYGMEALLFSIGLHWIRSGGARKTFYETEVVNWSMTLNAALTDLEQYDASSDQEQAAEEVAHIDSLKTKGNGEKVA